MNIFQGDVLLVIFLIVLLVFGARKLPELARSLGKAKGEFRKGQDESEALEAQQALRAEESRQAEEVRKADTPE
ncbi:MAG: twin-arginine translocase TatA/TatE family subunit [Actinomycetota bacterium]